MVSDEYCRQWSALWYNLEWIDLHFSVRYLVNILTVWSQSFLTVTALFNSMTSSYPLSCQQTSQVFLEKQGNVQVMLKFPREHCLHRCDIWKNNKRKGKKKKKETEGIVTVLNFGKIHSQYRYE